MESLNADDIEWLAKVANRLIRMRKREAANTNSPIMIEVLGDAITEVISAQSWLGSRLAWKPAEEQCTEPNRAACPRLCSDFCNAKERP